MKIAPVLVAGLLGIPAQAAVRLDARQSVGGVITNLPDGAEAAFLRGDQARTNRLEWHLREAIPAGWSKLVLTTGPSANIDSEASFFIGSPHPGSLLLKFLPTKPAASTRHEAWFYSPAPVSELWVQKYWPSPLHTLPIVGFDIEPASTPDPAGTLLMDVPLKDGRLALPSVLPAGNFLIHVPSGIPRDGFTVQWTAGGSPCELAGIGRFDFTLYSPAGIAELSVIGTTGTTGVVLQRNPIPPPSTELGSQHPRAFIEPLVSGDRSGTLTLRARGAVASPPVLPEFPWGRRTAIVLSWDDGVQNDLRCAMALQKHGFKGTYFLLHRPGITTLANSLETLGMEVGSHTWSHLPMSQRDPSQCILECVQMRKSLEEQLGHPVLSFAYPFGFTDGYDCDGNFVRRAVAVAGYWSARTTRADSMSLTAGDRTDYLMLPVSGRWNDAPADLEVRFKQVSLRAGGVFHLWGHSWEMAAEADWEHLEQLLTRYGNQPGVWYATQGELAVWSWMRQHTEVDPVEVEPGRQVYHVTQPTLHGSIDKLPLSIRVGPEVIEVEWQGRHLKPANGIVNLAWH